MRKILVTTDGSDNSERALIEARKYAEWSGGEITIMTVVDYLVMKPYAGVELPILPDNEELENVGQSVLDNALKLFEGFTGELKTKLRRGNPGDEIIKESEADDYDLIIMGSRGRGTFSRAILGSVSNKVLNHTKKNVTIIK